MVSRSRLRSLLTGLALYTMAAGLVGYFGVNAYTGKYGLNARQELDQEIIALKASSASRCCVQTGLTRISSMSVRAISSITPIRVTWFGPSTRTDRQITKSHGINFENVAALHCGIANSSQVHAILSWRFELG